MKRPDQMGVRNTKPLKGIRDLYVARSHVGRVIRFSNGKRYLVQSNGQLVRV